MINKPHEEAMKELEPLMKQHIYLQGRQEWTLIDYVINKEAIITKILKNDRIKV